MNKRRGNLKVIQLQSMIKLKLLFIRKFVGDSYHWDDNRISHKS